MKHTTREQLLVTIRDKHQAVRAITHDMQVLMDEDAHLLNEKDVKRLDKGVTVIKVGCKQWRKLWKKKDE